VAVGVWQVSKDVMFVGVLGKLTCTGISRAMQAEPNPLANECFDALFIRGRLCSLPFGLCTGTQDVQDEI